MIDTKDNDVYYAVAENGLVDTTFETVLGEGKNPQKNEQNLDYPVYEEPSEEGL